MKIKHLAIALIVTSTLVGCASSRGPAYQLSQADDETFSKPMREPKINAAGVDGARLGEEESEQQNLEIIQPPKLTIYEAAQQAAQIFVPKLGEQAVKQQSFNNLRIPAFINEVYGNQLGLNFVLQPSIRQAPDLVTLRLSTSLSQPDFYKLVTKTLEDYGVTTFEKDGVLVFDYAASSGDGVPLIATGQALPEVPMGNRPMYHIYPLQYVKPGAVRGMVSQLFNKRDLDISADIAINALILKGKSSFVEQAIIAIQKFDKPSLDGMQSVVLRPAINSVDNLAKQLQDILTTEGYAAKERDATMPIRFLPLESSGQLLVFARSQEILDYIVEWSKKLEVRRQTSLDEGLFSYQVKSTQASHIVNLLNELGVAQSTEPGTGTTTPGSSRRSIGRYAVDEQLNTILFSGSGKAWKQSLELIKKLDKPAPSVMIEVILAEVSLEESEDSAIEWIMQGTAGVYDVLASTTGALGYTGDGLNLTFSTGNGTRAALNLIYDNSRTKIRSRPRVMVKSGQQASIDVGDRVPIITANVQSTNSSDAQVVQQVTYQDTGVLLDIKPTVHATGFVDIEVSQELSEAVSTVSSTINSPTIRTRSLNTTLTLRDGGSVLIGGLIRSNDGQGERGIPLLGKLPGVGKLFRGDTMQQNRTELMIMIIPYILNSPQEAESLTDDLQRSRMQMIEAYE